MQRVIDSDQHLFEPRDLWRRYADPTRRGDALEILDDETGHPWLTWRGRRIAFADAQRPGEVDAMGERRSRARAGQPPLEPYDVALPEDYWNPNARLEALAKLGVHEAVLFPNYGLGWERTLDPDLGATLVNMTAWNRWAVEVAAEGGGRLHPVAHLTLRDSDWLEAELATLARGGIRLGLIAPALVDGRPLSDPSFERAWAAFVEHGVTPTFHVANQRRPFDEAWYGGWEDDNSISVLDSVFVWTAPALALADMILNGVLERHPDLRVGVVELTAIWVPMFLLLLNAGHSFISRRHGSAGPRLSHDPAHYFRRQVRVSCFAAERPQQLIAQIGELFMCCSDYPHSEGTAHPLEDYRTFGGGDGPVPAKSRPLFHDNACFLLRR